MVSTSTIRDRETSQQKRAEIQGTAPAIEHAVRLIHAICSLAGSVNLIDDIRAELRADKVRDAVRNRHTGPVFDWLTAALSYQGISDQVAYDYMQKHGRAAWRDIEQRLAQGASCPKLKSYWHFHSCRYEKSSRTDHINCCPLPSHDLRNGHLNQTAYALFLFIRDIADGDLIGWIDDQLQAASSPPGPDRLPSNGGGPDQADARDLRCLGQGPRYGPIIAFARRSQKNGSLDRGRRQHDSDRHVSA
jgi:hypothetical protein